MQKVNLFCTSNFNLPSIAYTIFCTNQMLSIASSFVKACCLILLIALIGPVHSQSIGVWNNASEGFRSLGMVRMGLASANPSPIHAYQAENHLAKQYQDRIGAGIEQLMGQLKTRIVLISSDRHIVYQNYATQSMRSSTPLGYSMSKSLTSLTVGHALCANPNIVLSTKAEVLIPRLKGSSWGQSSIEELLLMKSGSARQDPQSNGWQSEAVALTHRPVYVGGRTQDVFDLMIKHDLKEFKPGTSHQYSNYDTLTLGFVVEAITGKKFHEYFYETIWKEIAANRNGAWLVNGLDQTYTAAGFSAAPEDWLRIGHYVIDQINTKTCLGQFLSKAIEPKERSFTPTRCYGYQIWNWCQKDTFFFLGYGGQYLIMNPGKRWVAYVHQTTHENDAQLIALLSSGLFLENNK